MNSPEPNCPVEASLDAFHAGRFHLLQPKGRGFRAGLDAMLLAAMPAPDATGAALDLGAGAGAVAFGAASRCPGLALTLVENDPVMAGLARSSLALAANAALAPRLRVIEADILASRTGREAAGLADDAAAMVLTNPPFHPPGGRASPDPLRNAARAIPQAGFLGRWLRTASALLASGGTLFLIARPDNLREIIEVADNRLGSLKIIPVQPRADRSASRILVSARRGSRAPLSIHAPVVLHEANGAPTPLAVAVGRGEVWLAGPSGS